MAEKHILQFVQSSRNITDADSDDENEMSNKAPVPTSFELRNIMKILLPKRLLARFFLTDESHLVLDQDCMADVVGAPNQELQYGFVLQSRSHPTT
ncbi:hypothetical protein TNCV_2559551 [Trichonephila clavipes]|nr:hypothetical protein TNCV_2559551 [Trichonephila clavipes]